MKLKEEAKFLSKSATNIGSYTFFKIRMLKSIHYLHNFFSAKEFLILHQSKYFLFSLDLDSNLDIIKKELQQQQKSLEHWKVNLA